MMAVVERLRFGLGDAAELALAPLMQLRPPAVPAIACVHETLTVLLVVRPKQVPLPGVAVLVALVLVDGCEAVSVPGRKSVCYTRAKHLLKW
jgi:hypothetical protein